VGKKEKIVLVVFVSLVLVPLLAYAAIFLTPGEKTLFGRCKPGLKESYSWSGGMSCYQPSKYEGLPCTNKYDCGKGTCYIYKYTDKTGVCSDHERTGQLRYFDGNGDIKESLIIE
jgi:hypothetical protein